MERGDHGGPPTVIASQRGPVPIVTVARPAVRNAVDSATTGTHLRPGTALASAAVNEARLGRAVIASGETGAVLR